MATEVDILNVEIASELGSMHVLVNEANTGEPFRVPATIFFEAATNAQDAANAALSAATSASNAATQANTARDAANTAAIAANTAASQANAARDAANSAATSATNAASTANTATVNANTARDAANSAATSANNAATQANAARDAANAAATAATTAANNVQGAITNANDAATNANDAADEARNISAEIKSKYDDVLAAAAPFMPTIEVRITKASRKQGVRSAIFTNEVGTICSDRLQFRVIGDRKAIYNWAAQGLMLLPMRYNNGSSIKNSAGSRRVQQWSVIDGRSNYIASSFGAYYPDAMFFDFNPYVTHKNMGVYWCPLSMTQRFSPVKLIDLPNFYYLDPITNENVYSGEWIDVPWDMEVWMRRFCYITKVGSRLATAPNLTIVPMSAYHINGLCSDYSVTSPQLVCLKISGTRHRQVLSGYESDAVTPAGTPSPYWVRNIDQAQHFVSKYFGLALGMDIDTFQNGVRASQTRWIRSNIVEFKGYIYPRPRSSSVGNTMANNQIEYRASLINGRVPRKWKNIADNYLPGRLQTDHRNGYNKS